MSRSALAKLNGPKRLILASVTCFVAAVLVWVLLSMGISKVETASNFDALREISKQTPRAASSLQSSEDDVGSVVRTIVWARLGLVVFLAGVTLYEIRVFLRWRRQAKTIGITC